MHDFVHYFPELKLCIELSELLSAIFLKSWGMDGLPDDWRWVNVVPVFEKNKKEEPDNYRPASLISITGKIQEHIKADRHLEKNEVITRSQTNLISLLDWVSSLVDRGNVVDIVYVDFSKAFDMIS